MTKNYKAVLKSSLVMLVLFAVAGSGVAQAQECIAQVKKSEMVRAEGITEVVGDIEVRCRRPEAADFGFESDIPVKIKLAVVLSTNITSEIDDERIVKLEPDVDGMSSLNYKSGGIDLVAHILTGVGGAFALTNNSIDDSMFGPGELSEDGDMIEWEFDSAEVNFNNDMPGFNLVISGIRANASTVGDGEDIMVNVLVGEERVNAAPLKVADVTTGLAVKAAAVEGLQCSDADAEADPSTAKTATITIQESKDFADAIKSMNPAEAEEEDVDIIAAAKANSDSLVVTFLHIPEGVSVWVPAAVVVGMIDNPDAEGDQSAPARIADPAAFSLSLRHGTRTDGVGDVDDDTMLGQVELTASGAGEVIYNLADTSAEVSEEWVNLPVTFTWESEGDMPALGAGYVLVSFHPVSGVGGVTFDDTKLPRFVESKDSTMVLEIDDCITTLLFPFVTNQEGFDTGLVITNTSSDAGSCTIDPLRRRCSRPVDSDEVASERQTGSRCPHSLREFQGYITATCGFRDAYGFAFLSNGYGAPPSTLAQGYLAVAHFGRLRRPIVQRLLA